MVRWKRKRKEKKDNCQAWECVPKIKKENIPAEK